MLIKWRKSISMNQTLAKEYQNLYYSGDLCKNLSYYSCPIRYEEMFEGEKCEKKCYQFIERHFQCGYKMTAISSILSKNEDIEKLSANVRSVHMVSLYLLGYALAESFDKDLKKYFSKYIKSLNNKITSWYDFRYTWFLTALFHDIASCKENIDENNTMENIQYFEDVLRSKENIYNYTLQNGKKFIPRFSEDYILQYLSKRKEDMKLDHGIIAGYHFFESIYREYEQKLGNKEMQIEKINNDRILLWDRSHMDHFAFIADAIISHNIWFGYLDRNEYIEKWNYDRYPLNFILCLLDTVEPVKRFCENEKSKLKYKQVLENISIIQNGRRSIKISWNGWLENMNNEAFEKWKSNIKELDEWMDIEVKELDKKEFLILNW